MVAPTELVDLIDVRGGRISSHIEFFVPIWHFVGVLHLSSQHSRLPVRRVGMLLQGEILSLRSDVATPRRVAGCDTSQYLWRSFSLLVSDRLVV